MESPLRCEGYKANIIGLYAVIDACDWRELGRIFHRDVIYERPGYPRMVGRTELLQFYREERPIRWGRHTVRCALSDRDTVACWGLFEGLHRDGSALKERYADFFRFEDGLIRCRRTFFDRPAI